MEIVLYGVYNKRDIHYISLDNDWGGVHTKLNLSDACGSNNHQLNSSHFREDALEILF